MTRAKHTFHHEQALPIGAPDRLKPAQEKSNRWFLVLVFLLPLFFWGLTPPEGLSVPAWHLFLIFSATILGIVLRPFPMGAMAFLSLTAATVTQTLSLQSALAGFGNPQIWLVVLACFISRGFIKTGLAARVAYSFLSYFGTGPRGVAYGLILSEFVMAPVVPSNTARTGGILAPIARSIAQALGSRPEEGTAGQIGTYLTLVLFHASVVSSAMFITAMAPNPIIVQLAAEEGLEISWFLWAKAALLPGLVCLALIPPLLYLIAPPLLRDVSGAVVHAKEKLKEMGALRSEETYMILSFVLLLTLWIGGQPFGIDATQGALVGVCFLLLSGVLTWKDLLAEELAWDVLIWLSVLVVLAANLANLGFISWFSAKIISGVVGIDWPIALGILCLIYFYSHYFFASITAHVTSMFGPFLAVALAVGAPPMLAGLLLAFLSGLFGGLTHYGTGPAPVIFSLRYVSLKEWWLVGAMMSTLYLFVWGTLGVMWWKWLGIW